MRDYLITLREQRNESQQDVASSIGVSRQYYAMIEAGQRQKNMDVMITASLAIHFNVPFSTIFEKEVEYMKQNTSKKN